jgi:protein involved in polysaccharide export with SLBB domain
VKSATSNPMRSTTRRAICALLLAAVSILTTGVRAGAQVPGSPDQSQETQGAGNGTVGGAGGQFPGSGGASTAGPTVDAGTVLSAAQILSILQLRPEVVVELKSVIADQLQMQGTQVQPDAITDEMLYNQITSSRAVRASITSFLRARGFVSDEDLQRAAMTNGEEPLPAEMEGTEAGLGPGSLFSMPAAAEPARLAQANPVIPGEAESMASPRPSTSTGTHRDTGRTGVPVHSTTDEPQVLRRPAPYNLQSLRDLYTQIPSSPEKLKRFGSEIFVNRGTSWAMSAGLQASPQALDVPLGPDYVVGPGDTLSINLWGGATQTITRMIDREGRVMLPEAGEVQVAGLTLAQAQGAIAAQLQQQFRNAHVAVTVARLRTVRVYVVGDVQRPGAYDLLSLATPLTALYAAGGPTAAGSLRIMRHLRNDQPVGEIDLYDFLLHGVRPQDDRLEAATRL